MPSRPLPIGPLPIGLSTAIIAVIVSILWGGNVVSIRAGVDSVPPLWSAFWRMSVGVIFVTVWSLWRGVRMVPARQEILPLLALGLLFTVQIALMNTASALTSPAYGVVILNSYPVFANLAGHFGRGFAVHEAPITGIRALGLALAIGGVAVLALGRPDAGLAPHPLLGNLLMVISACLLGVRLVYMPNRIRRPNFDWKSAATRSSRQRTRCAAFNLTPPMFKASSRRSTDRSSWSATRTAGWWRSATS